MPLTTITEALQEIKTINARLQKKREAIKQYFIRDGRVRDPLEKEGGSSEFVRRERQAISDLEKRIVSIRSTIQRSNLSTLLSINGTEQSVQEWLNWRREVADGQKNFLNSLIQNIAGVRQQARNQGRNLTEKQDCEPTEITVCLNEKNLMEESEKIEEILSTLDGKLSLLNATTTIEV